MKNNYSRHHQAKHLLGFVISASGCPWMVLETGDAKVWLFCQGWPEGSISNRNCFIATGLQNPVEKKRVVDAARQALSEGMNVDMRHDPPLVYAERFTLTHAAVSKRLADKRLRGRT